MSPFLKRGRGFCLLERPPPPTPPASKSEWNEPKKKQALVHYDGPCFPIPMAAARMKLLPRWRLKKDVDGSLFKTCCTWI